VTDRLQQSDEAQGGQTELRGGQRRSDEARGRGQQPAMKLGAHAQVTADLGGHGLGGVIGGSLLEPALAAAPAKHTHGLPVFGMGSVSTKIFSAHDMTYE
jgi:hypothetical protein